MQIDKKLSIITILISTIAILSIVFFEFSIKTIDKEIKQTQKPMIAGIQTQKVDPIELTNEIPLPKQSQITSMDKLINEKEKKFIITIESKNYKKDVRAFYNEQLKNMGWTELKQGYYAKENKQLKLNIQKSIVTITITMPKE